MPSLTDLGWQNNWYAPMILIGDKWEKKFPDRVPEIVLKCRELKHRTVSENLDKTNHGYDTVTRCDECGYVYHTDSSD